MLLPAPAASRGPRGPGELRCIPTHLVRNIRDWYNVRVGGARALRTRWSFCSGSWACPRQTWRRRTLPGSTTAWSAPHSQSLGP
eukprot:1348377-Rhodomonas_salina.2